VAEWVDEGEAVAGRVVDSRCPIAERVDFGDGLADGVVDGGRDVVVGIRLCRSFSAGQ
jgi:hypothetical protein